MKLKLLVCIGILLLPVFSFFWLDSPIDIPSSQAEDGFYIITPSGSDVEQQIPPAIPGIAPPNPRLSYHACPVQTSTKFRWVNWYFDGRFVNSYNAMPTGNTTGDYNYYIGHLGSITGDDHEIYVRAKSKKNPTTLDTVTYTLTVYKGEYEQGVQNIPNVGSVYTEVGVDNIKYDGSSISQNGAYSWIRNGEDSNDVEVWTNFRMRVWDSNGNRIHNENEFSEHVTLSCGESRYESGSDHISSFSLNGYPDGDYTVEVKVQTVLSPVGSSWGYYRTINPSGTITK